MHLSKVSKKDIIFFLSILIIAPILSLVLKASFFMMIIFYFLVPSIYLSIRSPSAIKKAFLISIPAIPISLVLDYLAFHNNTWSVKTIFPFHFLGLIPLEDFIYSFLIVYIVVIIKEHFFEKNHKINFNHYKLFLLSILILIIIFFMSFIKSKEVFTISNYYFWLAFFIFLIPAIIGIIMFPRLRKIMLIIGTYFFFLMLPWELIALKLGIWTFLSQDYIFFIKIFGFKFPIEEFVTWIVLASSTIISLSEIGTGKIDN